jgi:hypothetical protein
LPADGNHVRVFNAL